MYYACVWQLQKPFQAVLIPISEAADFYLSFWYFNGVFTIFCQLQSLLYHSTVDCTESSMTCNILFLQISCISTSTSCCFITAALIIWTSLSILFYLLGNYSTWQLRKRFCNLQTDNTTNDKSNISYNFYSRNLQQAKKK